MNASDRNFTSVEYMIAACMEKYPAAHHSDYILYKLGYSEVDE